MSTITYNNNKFGTGHENAIHLKKRNNYAPLEQEFL